MHLIPSSIELLESRIAPALLPGLHHAPSQHTAPASLEGAPALLFEIAPDRASATYTDLDGDLVSLSVSAGRLKAKNFTLSSDPATGRVHIDLFDISYAKSGFKFQGSDITVRVLQTTEGSDRSGDLAAINARGIDLGSVRIEGGDLGQIDVGDSDFTTPALALLSAGQMGFYGIDEQLPGQDTVSKIRGPVGSIALGELQNAFIDVRRAGIGSITIGNVDASGSVADFNGSIRAYGKIGSLTVGGVAEGGILGGTGRYSGAIWSRTKIGPVTVAGDLTGGDGFDSGAIFAGSPDSDAFPIARKIGPVTINGSLIGGGGDFSGSLSADSGVKDTIIGGTIFGGTGDSSGALVSGRGFAAIRIDGDLISGTGPNSGSIIAYNGDAPSIAIAGRIIAGNFADSGIFINGSIGTLAFQSAPGGGGHATEIRALFDIDAIAVAGDMADVFIRAGANISGFSVEAIALIGSVFIGGDFTGGGIAAGAAAGADGFTFTADDVLVSPDGFPAFLSEIGSLSVGGFFHPLAVEAEHLGSITIAASPVILKAGASNDNLRIGTSIVREIS